MTTPCSGTISMSQVRTELGDTGSISLNDSIVRDLPYPTISGEISMDDLYCLDKFVGSWRTGGASTYHRQGAHVFGTRDSLAAIGGYNSTSTAEKYNGTSWSSMTYPGYNTYLGAAAGASSSSGVIFGGVNPGTAAHYRTTKEWNGTSWSTGGNLWDYVRCNGTGTSQSAAKVLGAFKYPGTSLTDYYYITYNYNGTSWSSSANMVFRTGRAGSFGTQSDCTIVAGNDSFGTLAATQEYNGTSWSFPANITSQSINYGSGGFNRDYGIVFGSSNTTTTRKWNGTSWSTGNSMAVTRNPATYSQSGTAEQALAVEASTSHTYAEEWY